MIGHEQILDLRRRRVRPVAVWVSDYPCCTAGNGTTVSLSPQDVPELIDWRFLIGLVVHVDGDDAQRVARIADACRAFAARVVATVYGPGKDYAGRPVAIATSITDTQGVLTWQSC